MNKLKYIVDDVNGFACYGKSLSLGIDSRSEIDEGIIAISSASKK